MSLITTEEILNALPSTYYVIDLKTKKVLHSNSIEITPGESVCYRDIFNKKIPCKEKNGICICEQRIEKGEPLEYTVAREDDAGSRIYKAKVDLIKENIVVANYVEITDEIKYKKESKITRKRLERAESLADFGYWEFNIETEFLIASISAAAIYGVEETQGHVDEFMNIALPSDRIRLKKELSDLVSGKKKYDIHFKIKRPEDGDIRHIHSIAEYRESKKMVFGVLHDTTETSKAKEALAESEKFLKLLFENMNNAFAYHKIICDDKGKPVDYIFMDVNTKFEELTGLKKGQIIGKNVLEVLPGIEKFWIEKYGEVALTGVPTEISEYAAEFDRFYHVSVFSPKMGYFAVTFSDITDKVYSEITLKETLNELELTQEFAKLGSWSYDPDNDKIEWSELVYIVLGRDVKKGIASSKELKIILKEYYELYEKSIYNAINNGDPFNIRLKLYLSEKEERWIEVICRPDAKKGPNGYYLRGSIQDITQSIQVQLDLDKSNKLLQTVIDMIPDAIYMKDSNYRKLIANKGDLKNCGTDNFSEILGKTDFEIFGKDIAEGFFEDDKKVIEEGYEIINREEVIPANGEKRWISISKFPFRNEDDKIVGLVGIARDITIDKKRKSQLRLFQQTIEQSPLSVVITNVNGDVEYVNQGFTEATGYKIDELLGKNPRILKSGLQNDSYYKNLWDTILSGKNWHGEFHNKRKGGELFWESAVIAPIFDENKSITHFVAIKENITEKKQMISDLESAKEKAIESDRLKTLFLANMSHEIRTPLNGILGFSSIICAGISDKKLLDYYGSIIENSGRRLITVIDDIIDISMIQSNQLKIVLEIFDLNDLLREIFIFYQAQHAEKLLDVEFEVEYCDHNRLNIINSDKNRLYQVLKNLLDNAFKFTSKGFIKFGCRSENEADITFFIEDSGIGIDDKKQKMIFESFRQAEEGSSRRFEGSGLGLSIISGIIEKLNGEIELHSVPGKGSEFSFKIPRNNSNKVLVNKHVEAKKINVSRNNMAKSIVSFEDDQSSINYLNSVAKILGFKLTNFVYAKEGIEFLRKNNADLVLMDIQLPEMNGYEATKIIKSEFPDLPVIVQTAFAMSGDKEKAFDAGCDDYISKPIPISALKEKIAKYLG